MTLGETRAEFFGRIRRALPGTAVPPAEGPDLSPARLASRDDDLVELFLRNAASVGMQARRVEEAELPAAIVELLRDLGNTEARSVALGVVSARDRGIVESAVAQAGCAIASREPDALFDADIGITDVHAALAETGTLVLHARQEQARGVSLVPPVHVAIVRPRYILPDLLDYAAQVDAAASPPPSCTVLVTGPSKTADIEGELIRGVHGPAEVHVWVVAES